MKGKRNNFSNEFKLKVALDALKGASTITEIANKHHVHPNQISIWKRHLLEHGPEIFNSTRGQKKSEKEVDTDQLLQQLGLLTYQLNWLKKKYESES